MMGQSNFHWPAGVARLFIPGVCLVLGACGPQGTYSRLPVGEGPGTGGELGSGGSGTGGAGTGGVIGSGRIGAGRRGGSGGVTGGGRRRQRRRD